MRVRGSVTLRIRGLRGGLLLHAPVLDPHEGGRCMTKEAPREVPALAPDADDADPFRLVICPETLQRL